MSERNLGGRKVKNRLCLMVDDASHRITLVALQSLGCCGNVFAVQMRHRQRGKAIEGNFWHEEARFRQHIAVESDRYSPPNYSLSRWSTNTALRVLFVDLNVILRILP